MDLEDIKKEYKKDCTLDRMELGEEALKTNELHAKYLELYSDAEEELVELENQEVKLYKDKKEFYVLGPTKEQVELGWELPPRGKIIKSEVDTYIKADKQMREIKVKIAKQKIKVKYLLDIINFLHYNRKGLISEAIGWIKFNAGCQ